MVLKQGEEEVLEKLFLVTASESNFFYIYDYNFILCFLAIFLHSHFIYTFLEALFVPLIALLSYTIYDVILEFFFNKVTFDY